MDSIISNGREEMSFTTCTTCNTCNWSNQCWQIHLLTNSLFFQLPALSKQTTVVFFIVIVEQTIEVPEPKPQILISFTGLWERAVDEQTIWRICEIFTWTVSPLLFMLCYWSFKQYILCCCFQPKYMKSFNHGINSTTSEQGKWRGRCQSHLSGN